MANFSHPNNKWNKILNENMYNRFKDENRLAKQSSGLKIFMYVSL